MSRPELLAAHFADLVLRMAGTDSEALRRAAALASARTSQGSVCADLSAEGEGRELADALSAFPAAVTTDPDATGPRPLVLVGSRLYLHRYWEHERQVVRRVRELAGARAEGADPAALTPAFRSLFPDLSPGNGGDRFATAAWIATTRRLAIVTGGPGTGKTSLAARLLAFLAEAGGRKPLRAALAAPTGKAAQRLTESIARQLAEPRNRIPRELAACVPTEAATLHRLLGWNRFTREWRRNGENPLEEDVVVVDEASMADLPMVSRLLSSLKPGSRLLLLGDRDQLASVEAGFVLGDLCGEGFDGTRSPGLASELVGLGIPTPPPSPQAPPLSDAVVVLERSWRYQEGSPIDRAARLVNLGGREENAREAFSLLSPHPLPPPWKVGGEMARLALARFRPMLEAARKGDVEKASALLGAFRILCALREGPYGVGGVNRAVEEAARREAKLHRDERDYPGRPVMVTVNDPGRRLYNGDVGLMVEGGDRKLKVWFPDGEEAGEKGLRKRFRDFTPAQLPPHETAFAMTVHKSQGSEFDSVALILPPGPETPVLTRELLYTAVTRAREQVEVWGSEEAFCAAVARRTVRSSGLRQALWGKN